MALPPGPPLPAAAQTLYVPRPVEFLDGCQRRYGDCFTIETYAFGRRCASRHPEVVKQVFTGDPDMLRAGEANAPLGPLLGPRSVLLLDGPEHLRQRRLMMPPFHGERVLGLRRTMREITEHVVADVPVGRALRAPPAHAADHARDHPAHDLRRRGGRAARGPARRARPAPRPAVVADRRALDRSRRSVARSSASRRGTASCAIERRADALIYRQIARRRAERAPRGRHAGGRARDAARRARDEQGKPMTDAELRDELMTLLAAGHETTATVLCWAFDLVLGDRRVHETLRRRSSEAPPGAGHRTRSAKLDYLDATIKESLRLQPVIPAVGRRLKAPMKIGGHDSPAGSSWCRPSWLTHRRPDLYPEPEAFRPERFLGEKPDPYAWYPVRRRASTLHRHGVRALRDEGRAGDGALARAPPQGPTPRRRRAPRIHLSPEEAPWSSSSRTSPAAAWPWLPRRVRRFDCGWATAGAAPATRRERQQKARLTFIRRASRKSRRRPTLPLGRPSSTIGSKELNFRVRDGIGCSLLDITTGNLWVSQREGPRGSGETSGANLCARLLCHPNSGRETSMLP